MVLWFEVIGDDVVFIFLDVFSDCDVDVCFYVVEVFVYMGELEVVEVLECVVREELMLSWYVMIVLVLMFDVLVGVLLS